MAKPRSARLAKLQSHLVSTKTIDIAAALLLAQALHEKLKAYSCGCSHSADLALLFDGHRMAAIEPWAVARRFGDDGFNWEYLQTSSGRRLYRYETPSASNANAICIHQSVHRSLIVLYLQFAIEAEHCAAVPGVLDTHAEAIVAAMAQVPASQLHSLASWSSLLTVRCYHRGGSWLALVPVLPSPV